MCRANDCTCGHDQQGRRQGALEDRAPHLPPRSPDGCYQIPRWAGGWACTSQPPWRFGFDSQTRNHRLVVSRSTCPPFPSPPLANCFVIGTAVINTHRHKRKGVQEGRHAHTHTHTHTPRVLGSIPMKEQVKDIKRGTQREERGEQGA